MGECFPILLSIPATIVPFGNVLAPLIIYLTKKDQLPFVADQARESLNFQISISIYFLFAGALAFVLIGFALMPIIGLFMVIMVIIASLAANRGERYRYPLTIRLVK